MIVTLRHPHRRLIAVLRMWLAAVVMSGLIACERDTASSDSGSSAAPAAAGATGRRPHAQLPAAAPSAPLAARAWWNQDDMIEALSLTPEQRAKMDALLLQSMEAQRAAQHRQREQQRALREALDAGKWDAARQAADAAADSITAAWRAQIVLKIDVLALLDPDQQRLVTSRYRHVLRQMSVLSRRRADGRRQLPTPTAHQ